VFEQVGALRKGVFLKLQKTFDERFHGDVLMGVSDDHFVAAVEPARLWRGDLAKRRTAPFGGEAVVIHWMRSGWKNRGRFAAQRG
jgi:hypothetical protein